THLSPTPSTYTTLFRSGGTCATIVYGDYKVGICLSVLTASRTQKGRRCKAMAARVRRMKNRIVDSFRPAVELSSQPDHALIDVRSEEHTSELQSRFDLV